MMFIANCGFICSSSVLLSCGKKLVGILPTLMKHGQDKELHLRQAILEVCAKDTVAKMLRHIYHLSVQVINGR